MKGYIIALQFLTRIRINQKMTYDEKEFGASSAFFPLVGLTLGLFLGSIYYLLTSFTQLSQPTVVVLIVISEIFLSGALHLDGFMDTVDGIFSGRSREKILEIMKDSRVGAHSVVGILVLLLLKISFLLEIDPAYLQKIIIFYPILGRWVILVCLAYFHYPREAGIGKYFKDNLPVTQLKYSHLFFISIAIFLNFPNLLLTLAATLGLTWLTARYINNVIGGHTGDTYGAMNEISELIFIMAFAILT